MPPSLDIEPLLERVAAGDAAALEALYDRTSAYVFGLVRRILGDPDAAAEVAQDVYLRVWRTAGTFDPRRASAWTWLALLARSRAIDRLRADRTYREVLDDLEREPQLATGRPNPEREAASMEEARLVQAALAALPPEQQHALELAFFGGLSHREIAERTGTPLGTVKTRIRTAMMRLEEALGPALGR